jgi:hypothetical protein
MAVATVSIPATEPRSPRIAAAQPEALPVTLAGRSYQKVDLTIHRVTETHHGRALRILGHAAEHLVLSASCSTHCGHATGDSDAIRILMRLSREIFDDYAAMNTHRHPVTHWVMERAVRVYGAA